MYCLFLVSLYAFQGRYCWPSICESRFSCFDGESFDGVCAHVHVCVHACVPVCIHACRRVWGQTGSDGACVRVCRCVRAHMCVMYVIATQLALLHSQWRAQ